MENDSQQALLVLEFITYSETILRICLVLFFGLAMILDAAAIYWREKEGRWTESARRAARGFFLFGVFLSAGHFTLLMISPSSRLFTIILSGLASLIAIVALLLERDKQELRPLKFLMGAIIWALTVAAPFFNESSSASLHSLPGLSLLHIATAISGEALCMVAFSSSLIYLWDYSRLKSRVLERRPFMPSLETLDKLVGRTSMLGFLLISTSLATGVMLIFDIRLRSHLTTLKVIWAFAVWGWYLLALVGRGYWGWTGRRGAQLSIWGTLLLGLTLFGTIWNISGQGR
ncbi:hypothetical protein EBR21_07935 [bacterium]|nr:hypothetical protein [bacterium]